MHVLYPTSELWKHQQQADDDSSGEYPTTSANALHKREFGHRTTVAIYYTSIRPLTQDPAQMRAM